MKYQEFIFCGKLYLPLFHDIFVQKIPIQECFLPERFYLSTDFQNVAAFYTRLC